MRMNTSAQGRPSLIQSITFQSLLFLKKNRHERQVNFFVFSFFVIFFYVSPTTKQKQKGKNKIYLVKKANKHTREYQPHAIAPWQRRQERA